MNIKPGLVSVTFRAREPEEIVELCTRAELEGIEWAGDVHVPPGNLSRAADVGRLTRSVGLDVVSYGSYYRVGVSEDEGLSFDEVLDTALALEAPSIRVWAGLAPFESFDEQKTQHIVQETKRIAAKAERAGIELSFEYHRKTLTETAESAVRLLNEVGCSNVHIYWQPVYGMSAADNIKGMQMLLPYITHVHVFHWWPTNQDRHLLKKGANDWLQYLEQIKKNSERTRFAMIEFVKDDRVDKFMEDAATLRQWLAEA